MLVRAARRRGYNLWTLRLTLLAYRMPRAIGADGCYSRPVTAVLGITAGSGMATTELRVMLLDVVDYLAARRGQYASGARVETTLFVDDLTIEAIGEPEAVELACSAATLDACTIMEKGLQLEVSRKSLLSWLRHREWPGVSPGAVTD